MSIEKIIYRAATVNMGGATEQDGDNYRAWALRVISEQYPDAEVEVRDEDRNTEVEVSGGRIDAESNDEWEGCHEWLAGLWDICPWYGEEFDNE